MVENNGENWSNVIPNETSRFLLLCMTGNRNLVWSAVSPIGKYQLHYFQILCSKWTLDNNVRSVNNRLSIKARRESYGSDVSPKVNVTAPYDVSRISQGFRALYMPNSLRSHCEF